MQSWQRDCALEGSGLQLREAVFVSTHFSFLRMCGTSSNSRGFSGCTPPRLSWTGRPMLLALPPLAAVANNSGSSASSAVCSLSGGTPDCRVPVQWWRRALLARLTVLLAMPLTSAACWPRQLPLWVSPWPHGEEEILSGFVSYSYYMDTCVHIHITSGQFPMHISLPSPCQEAIFIWPAPFFQYYNRRRLRPKAGGACLYTPHNGYWPASFSYTPPQKLASFRGKTNGNPWAKLLLLLL